MKDIIERLAQYLYEAYCCHTEWKSAVTGAPLPQWQNISPAVRDAWYATARAAQAFSIPAPVGDPPEGPKPPKPA
jgi:hypothetical protein